MVITTVSLFMVNITASLVREVVANPQRAAQAIRRSLALASLVGIVVMIACLLLPSLILAPLGSNFVSHGTSLMHWAGLSAPATMAIVFFWTLCSIERRPWPSFGVNLFVAVAVFGGVLLLRSGSDIGRVGMIYCAVQWTAALVVVFPTVTGLRAIARRTDSRRQLYGSFREHGSSPGPRLWSACRRAGRTAGRGGG
jgi:Na+-driven multidrug efflux pump